MRVEVLYKFAVDLQAPYTVYNELELRERQQRAVDDVAGVLSVDKGDVVRVLREYKWCAIPSARQHSPTDSPEHWLACCQCDLSAL